MKIHPLPRSPKSLIVKTIFIGFVVLSVAWFGKQVYEKREALLFAWTKTDQTIAAEVTYNKISQDGEKKYLETLSRVFIPVSQDASLTQ